METPSEFWPERGYRERTRVIRLLPPYVIEVRKRFGVDIANIVLFVKKTWGDATARALARRILQYTSVHEVIRELERKVSLLDPDSRRILSELVFRIKYNTYLDSLVSKLRGEDECVQREALRYFHKHARDGVFYAPSHVIARARKACASGGVR